MNRSRTRSPGAEEAGPVAGRRRAVHQVRIGRAAHVGEIGGIHPHRAPCAPLGERRGETEHARIAQEVHRRALPAVVVVRLLAQPRKHRTRILVRPVGEQHDMVAIGGDGVGAARIHDQRAIESRLLLKHRVAVIPVGAALTHREPVLPGSACRYPVKAQPRHAVHVRGQQDAVPMDRAVLGQRVVHAQRHGVAFAPAQHGRGQRSVDRDRVPRAPGVVDRRLADRQIELGAAVDDGLS